MNEPRRSALEEDWLAGNAVVAFVGAFLMARSGSHRMASMSFRIIACGGGLPASAPGAVESMTRLVYQRGVRFDSAYCVSVRRY